MRIVISIIFINILFLNQLFASEMKGKFGVDFSRGLSSPTGNFADTGENGGAAKAGIGFIGSMEYYILDKLSIGGEFSYHPFKTETGDFEADFKNIFITMAEDYRIADPDIRINAGDENKITSFGLYLKYILLKSNKGSPYIKVGAGMGMHKQYINLFGFIEPNFGTSLSLPRINRYQSLRLAKNVYYIESGGGYLFKLNETFGLKAEIQYARLMTNNKDGDFVSTEKTDTSETAETIREKYKYNCVYVTAFIGFNIFFGGPKAKKK